MMASQSWRPLKGTPLSLQEILLWLAAKSPKHLITSISTTKNGYSRSANALVISDESANDNAEVLLNYWAKRWQIWKQIKEINTGTYIFDNARLFSIGKYQYQQCLRKILYHGCHRYFPWSWWKAGACTAKDFDESLGVKTAWPL